MLGKHAFYIVQDESCAKSFGVSKFPGVVYVSKGEVKKQVVYEGGKHEVKSLLKFINE
jgi:hypothetical protein